MNPAVSRVAVKGYDDMILEQVRELNRQGDYDKALELLNNIGIEATILA